ncbi:MAG: flagellar protein FlaG [Acidobacteriota bacterium]|nr:flagellar protein FlaG [Acidobacteriota bacterium]
MADQVNPLGTLAPGLPPVSQAAVVTASQTPSAPDSTPRSATPAPVPEGQGAPTAPSSSPAALQAAAQDVQKYLAKAPSELQFDVDKSTGRFLFKVINPVTKEVIYQVPSEEVLAMARKLRELDQSKGATGVLVDKEG